MNKAITLKKYLAFIYVITIFSLIFFGIKGYYTFNVKQIGTMIFFIGLTILTESFIVVFRNVSLSTGFAILLASYLLLGVFATIIITIIGFTLRVVKINDKYTHILNTPFYKTCFNYCDFILMILYGNYFFIQLGGKHLTDPHNYNVWNNIFPIIAFVVIYIITNTAVISGLIATLTKKRFLYAFVQNLRLVVLSNFALAPFGVILAIQYIKHSYLGVILFVFAILFARYVFSLYDDSKNKYIQTVNALTRAIEARDKYIEGHSQRVSEMSESIAKEMKLNEWKIEQLKMAALLHDVGKIGIDDAILKKPGNLTEEEYDAIKNHPVIGYNILKDVKDLEPVLDLVKYHHERYDGKGYPEGKTVDELGIDVFIIQLADSIDAMSTDRPYRKALSEGEIVSELIRCCGTQFHPKVVEAYLKTKGIDMQTLIREKEEAEKKGDCLCS